MSKKIIIIIWVFVFFLMGCQHPLSLADIVAQSRSVASSGDNGEKLPFHEKYPQLLPEEKAHNVVFDSQVRIRWELSVNDIAMVCRLLGRLPGTGGHVITAIEVMGEYNNVISVHYGEFNVRITRESNESPWRIYEVQRAIH